MLWVGVGFRGDGGATVEGVYLLMYTHVELHASNLYAGGAQINTATGTPRMRVGSGWDVGTHILGAGGAPDMACPTLVTDPGGDGDDRRAALPFRRAINCLAAPAPTGRAGIQGEEAGPPPHWYGLL